MKSNTLLIRHGHVDSPMSPMGPLLYGSEQPLNKLGFQQMAKLGESLTAQGVSPSIIYTSPFPRAVQSAQILRDQLPNHPEVIIRDNLRGATTPQWEGQPVNYLEGVTEDIFSPNPRLPDIHGETLQDGYKRVAQEYDYLLSLHPEETIAVLTHSEIAGIISHYERTGDKNMPGIDQPIGKAEALFMQRNTEGEITTQRLITPEFQPSRIEVKK